MRVALYDVQVNDRINKDCMGGFGLGFGTHMGLVGRLIGWAKKRCVFIPDLDLAYIGAEHAGDDVKYVTRIDSHYDRIYIHASVQNALYELAEGERLKKGGMSVCFSGPMTRFMPHLFAGFDIRPDPSPLFLEGRPSWDSWPIRSFRYYPSLRVRPVVPVLTASGCKYRCAYCPYRAYYGEWRPRPVDKVIGELDDLKARYGIRGVIFRDPLFTGDRDRTLSLCQALPGLEWACETRLENVDSELLETMARSGCRAIHFGIESASPDVLKTVARSNPPVAVQKRIIEQCKRLGIRVNCFFVFGFPAETPATAEMTIDRAIELSPDVAEFFISQPYPGTPYFKMVEADLFNHPLTCYDGFTELFRHPHFATGQLEALCNRAYRRFYLRPAFIGAFLKSVVKPGLGRSRAGMSSKGELHHGGC